MLPVTTRKWTHRAATTNLSASELKARVEKIADSLQLPPLLAQLLVVRGHTTPDAANAFLTGRLADIPDPALMKDMDRACQRLVAAVQKGEPVRVMSDYDQDGQASSAILVEFFTEVGADVSLFVPLRERDGYGLSADAIRAAAKDGVRVIVSCDCGVSNHAEADLCRELGIDLIVTDHHQPPPTLPRAYAVVNPHRLDCSFPDKNLCGAGVAFYLTVALRKALRDAGYFNSRQEPDLRSLLDLVALATVADLVPIGGGVNRIFVQAGLELMERGQRTGLAALRQVVDLKRVTAGSIGFILAPRFNASGRLGDARLGVELLLEKDINAALQIATTLDRMNRERQEIEAATVEKAVARVEKGETGACAIVLADPDYHEGVIGIAASRLVELYHRPTVLIALNGDTGKGSCRSIRGFNMFEALTECSDLLLKFGGHEYAAGLSVKSSAIKDFALVFDSLAAQTLSEQDMVPEIMYDAVVDLANVTEDLVGLCARLEPFGLGNPGPNFVARRLQASDTRILKDKHLKFTVRDSRGRPVTCIAFQQADKLALLENGAVDILFQASINHWNGRSSVQCEVKDVRPG